MIFEFIGKNENRYFITESGKKFDKFYVACCSVEMEFEWFNDFCNKENILSVIRQYGIYYKTLWEIDFLYPKNPLFKGSLRDVLFYLKKEMGHSRIHEVKNIKKLDVKHIN